MTSRATLLFVSILAGAALTSSAIAAPPPADTSKLSDSGPQASKDNVKVADAADKSSATADDAAKAEAAQAKAKAAKAAKLRAAQKARAAKAARAKAAAQAKAASLQKAKAGKPDRLTTERDRGLDVASKYAPNTIARVRKNGYLEKGETVKTGGGNVGWRSYVNRYYKGL